MKDILVPIDQAGRVVLPKDIREELSIRPGDLLTVSIQGAAVTLTPNRETIGFVRKGRALIFSSGQGPFLRQETVQAILEEERESHAVRVAEKISGRKRKK